MLLAEPQYRRRFKFWERVILGAAPRGQVGGAAAGAALPPTPLSPSPSRPAAPRRLRVRRKGRAAPPASHSPRRGGPAPSCGGTAARHPRRGERRVRPARYPRQLRASAPPRARRARRSWKSPRARIRSAEAGALDWTHLPRCLPSPGRSGAAFPAERAVFGAGLAERLRGPLKHRLLEKSNY